MAETIVTFGHAVPEHRNEASDEATNGVVPVKVDSSASRAPGPAAQPIRHERADPRVAAEFDAPPRAGVDSDEGPPQGEGFTLTKAELAEMLFERVGLNKREAKDMVETFFDEIRGALERGGCVKLSGFGNFQLRDKPQRPGRNPKTGEEIPISARRVVTFHASQKLKSQIEGS